MRVSDSTLTAQMANNVQRSTFRLSQLQQELSSGVRINNPSDDPAGASKALMLRSEIRNSEQFQRNINGSLGFMNYVDSVMNDMVNTVTHVQSDAIQGASDTMNPADRKTLASDVNQMLEHMISLSQSKYQGQYVFSGTETLEQPYTAVRDANGNVTSVGNTLRKSVPLSDTTTAVGTLLGLSSPPSGTVTIGDKTVSINLATDSLDAIQSKIEAAAPTGVTAKIEQSVSNGAPVYSLRIEGTTTATDSNNVLSTLGIGNVVTTGTIQREVDDGIHIQVNVPGKTLFEGAQSAFTALIHLRDSLQNNDLSGIQQSITDLQTVQSKISNTRGTLGARTQRVQFSQSLQEQFQVQLSSALGNVQDTNLPQTVIDLQAQQQAYQAAIATGGTVFQPTLLSFLH